MTHKGWLKYQIDAAGMHKSAMTPVIAGASAVGLASSRMAVPVHVRLGPDCVEWRPGNGLSSAERWWPDGKPASGALWAFIRLATEPDGEQFVAFSRRYGVLGLSPGGRPAVSLKVPGMMPGRHDDGSFWEPLAAWRVYAANAKAIVHLAAALRGGERVNAKRIVAEAGLEDDRWAWRQHIPMPTWGDDQTKHDYTITIAARWPATVAWELDLPEHDVASQRQWLAWYVTQHWLAESALVPILDWTDDRPRLALPIGRTESDVQNRFWPPNMLFNILAAHLVSFMCSEEPVARCSRCGGLHPRKRVARDDQPSYCDDCRPEAERQRKREYASRKRAHEHAGT